MSQQMECMCRECGISIYLFETDIALDDPASSDPKLLDRLLVCPNCGGLLALVGKAGDEPRYRLD